MKQHVIKLLVASLMVGMLIAGSFFRITITDKGDVTLKNTEALANGEGSYSFCYGGGNIVCHGAYVKVSIDAR